MYCKLTARGLVSDLLNGGAVGPLFPRVEGLGYVLIGVVSGRWVRYVPGRPVQETQMDLGFVVKVFTRLIISVII